MSLPSFQLVAIPDSPSLSSIYPSVTEGDHSAPGDMVVFSERLRWCASIGSLKGCIYGEMSVKC